MECVSSSPKQKKTKVSTSYIFEDSIERVYEAITNFKVYTKVLQAFIREITITNGKSWGEVGAKVEVTWYTGIAMMSEVIEVENSRNFKKIVLTVKSKECSPVEFSYRLFCFFFWKQKEFKTYFMQEMVFDQPVEMSECEVQFIHSERKKMFKKTEDYLIAHPEGLIQEESVTIKRSVEEVWDVLTDWNKLKLSLPSLADDIIYEGDPRKVNTLMHVYKHSGKVEYHLKVSKIKIDRNNNREYILNFFAGKPRSPKQDLKYKLISTGEDSCLLSFKHIFHEYVKSKHLLHISKEKSLLLAKLKSSLEIN